MRVPRLDGSGNSERCVPSGGDPNPARAITKTIRSSDERVIGVAWALAENGSHGTPSKETPNGGRRTRSDAQNCRSVLVAPLPSGQSVACERATAQATRIGLLNCG